jgi:hypothetical protein
MKYLTLFILLIFSGQIFNAQTPESVIVEYESEHYGVKSKHVLYYTDFGKKKVMDVHNPNNTTKRYLSKDKMDYTYMLERKDINFKYPSIKNDVIYHVLDMSTLCEKDYYISATKTGTENILGKECDIYTVQTADKKTIKYSVWNGIVLKKESDQSKLNALKINLEPIFEEYLFEIPEGYVFK